MKSSYDKINNISLVIIATFCVAFALVYTKSILIPFVFALFTHAVISPAIDFFQSKCKINRLLSTLLTALIFLGVSSLLLIFVSRSITGFLNGASIYQEKVFEFFWYLIGIANNAGFNLDPNNLQSYLRGLPFFSWARGLTGGVVGFLGNLSLVLVFVLFLLAGETSKENENKLLGEIRFRISRYMSVKVLTSFVTGLIVAIVLLSLNVELAFMFAVLTFVFNFIPSFGSIIATALPVPVLLLQYGADWRLIVFLVFCGGTQFTIGNILEPKFMGENMDLHPVTVLLCLVMWGLLWGLPGLFLSVPITAALKIILSRIETTRGFAEMLAGRIPRI